MRAIALSLTLFCIAGCDSFSGDLVPRDVYARAESAKFVEITADAQGRAAAVFDYVGSVPAACYEFSGFGTANDGQRLKVTVMARMTAASCAAGQGTVRRERLELPSLSPEPGTYTYAFDRQRAAPLEVSVTFP